LLTQAFRYEKPSTHLHIMWVLLLGQVNIQFLQFIFNIVYWRDLIGALINVLFTAIFFALAIGTYGRKYWAFIGTQMMAFVILLITVLRWAYPIELGTELLSGFDPSITRFVAGLGNGFSNFLNILAIAAAFMTFAYAALLVAPDFERQTLRRIARVAKGLSAASDFHINAQRAAKAGMWATAVLHWQHAAAKEPSRISYQQHLAEAYGRLGFYQRSLDVLQSMYNRVTHPDRKREIEQLINSIKQQQAASETAV
jgi:hypothetical protein